MNGLKLRDIDNLHPIDKFHFIEFIDKDGNLNVAFALYYFKGIYFSLSLQKFFTLYKITMCKKLTEYVNTDKDFISIQMAEYYKVKHAEDFILQTQWYNFLKQTNLSENGVIMK